MAQLDKHDLNFSVRRLPKVLVELMKDPQWEGKIFVGGGYIRGIVAGEKISDIDLFVRSTDDAAQLSGLLSERPSDIVKTENAYTVKRKMPIQIIHRWVFNNPEDVADSFDFTVCCAVIFFKHGLWDSFCDDRFYTDLASKRLVYRSPVRNEDAGGSILRVLKYYQRGYRIPLDSLAAVISRLMNSVDESKVQDGAGISVISIEAQRAKVITGLLREVDPNIDPNHNSHLSSMSGE